MSREIITISKMGAVTVPTAPVWMTQFEIAGVERIQPENLAPANHTHFGHPATETSD